MSRLYLYGGIAIIITVLSGAVWWLIGERAEVTAERDRARAEAAALIKSHEKEIAARDAAWVVQKWEAEQAKVRANELSKAIQASDNECLGQPLPDAVFDRLPH